MIKYFISINRIFRNVNRYILESNESNNIL